MSLWKRLFGGGSGEVPAAASEPETYKGFVIRAAPVRSGAHYQAAGVIAKEIDGVLKEHRFIRADYFASHEDATAFSFIKARQIIDLQGERVFD